MMLSRARFLSSPPTYTQTHLDYVIEVVTRAARLRIVSQPLQLRNFTAPFAPLH